MAVRALKKGACEGRVTFFAGWSGKPSLGLGQLDKGWNEVKDRAVQTSWGEALQAAEGVGVGVGSRCKGPEAGIDPKC